MAAKAPLAERPETSRVIGNVRFKRRWGEDEIEMVVGRRSVARAADLIDSFRAAQGLGERTVTSVDWFLSMRAVWSEVPLVLLHRRRGALQGVAMLHYSTKFGIPFGLARGGVRGDASVIAPPIEQRRIAEATARFLTRSGLAHTVVITVPIAAWAGTDAPMRWFPRQDAQYLSLAGGLDATMARLSYRLRRNLRYYRRRSETEDRVRFLPDLTASQRRQAVEALCDKGHYPTPRRRARRFDRELQTVPGAFAMGLQTSGGEWLSFIAGWRENTATFVDWQLNDEREASSTVMRAFLLEHETRRQSPALVFVGGSSPIWRRACEPAMASDLLVTGQGPVARLLRHAYQRLRPDTDVAQLYERASGMAGAVQPGQ